MTGSGFCLSAAGRHPRGRLASAGAIGALVLALATPAAAAAAPVFGGPAVTGTITVGSGPASVAVDPSSGAIYVANRTSGTVSVINPDTNRVTATVTVGTDPQGVAVNSAAGTVYVTNDGSNNVSVISELTNTVGATITVGTHPSGIAFNSVTDTVYVANNGSNSVSVINGLTNTVTSTITGLNQPAGIAVNPTTNIGLRHQRRWQHRVGHQCQDQHGHHHHHRRQPPDRGRVQRGDQHRLCH